MAVSHVYSNAVADWTGTVTGFNSQGSTTTIAATAIVRPSDWNSAHNQYYSLTGNTTGNSTASGTNVIIAGSGGVSVGGSTGTLVISCPAQVTASGYAPFPDRVLNTGQIGQGTLQFDPEEVPLVQFDRLCFLINNTNSSNSSGSHTLSFRFGIYTRNVSTLSLLASTSTSTAVTHSGTAGSYSLFSGLRMVTIPWTTTLTQGKYWFCFGSNTTSGGANGSYSNIVVSGLNSAFSGHFGSSHATTAQMSIGQGVYTATSTGMPASVAFTQIRGSDSMASRFPWIGFASGTV